MLNLGATYILVGLDPQVRVEEKVLDQLTEEAIAIGSRLEIFRKVKEAGNEFQREVLGGETSEEVGQQLHGVCLDTLKQEAAGMPDHVKHEGQ